MSYRRPIHCLSGVYRPLPTQRFVMMTMGGYWPVIQKMHNGNQGSDNRNPAFGVTCTGLYSSRSSCR